MKNCDRDLFFKAMVCKQCTIVGLKKYQLADKIGIPYSTFYTKLKRPGKFTIDEMRDLCCALKCTVEDKTSII